MSAYYNEIDPQAAQWLRNLIAAGARLHLVTELELIPERSGLWAYEKRNARATA